MDSLEGFPELMSTVEAARALHVVPSTIRRWLNDGALVGVRVGTKWVVPKQAVLDMLEPITIHLAGGRSLFAPPKYGDKRNEGITNDR